jgi:hypothetical protein
LGRFAALREELSYADYLVTLEKFRVGVDDNPDLLQILHSCWSIRSWIYCTHARSTRSRT